MPVQSRNLVKNLVHLVLSDGSGICSHRICMPKAANTRDWYSCSSKRRILVVTVITGEWIQ